MFAFPLNNSTLMFLDIPLQDTPKIAFLTDASVLTLRYSGLNPNTTLSGYLKHHSWASYVIVAFLIVGCRLSLLSGQED